MSLAQFVAQLLETGKVALDPEDSPTSPEDAQASQSAILELDRRARAELADPVPELLLPAAIWALRLLRHGCRALVFRELDAEAVAAGLSEPCPVAGDSAAALYSVDLGLRWLPDLTVLARGIAAEDPLVTGLRGLARDWPLSSVGLDVDGGELPLALRDDPCLRRLYVDRVIAREALSRLDCDWVADAARAALGGYPELSPAVARALNVTALSAAEAP